MAHGPSRRNSQRWRAFDYRSVATYGVTICVQGRHCLLGRVQAGRMIESAAGAMVRRWWRRIPSVFPHVRLDAHIVMPNHVHGILRFASPRVGTGVCAHTLGDVIRWWKSQTTARYAQGVRDHGWSRFPKRLWQRGYYDRVLRDDGEVQHGRLYIFRNPAAWDRDPNNPERRS